MKTFFTLILFLFSLSAFAQVPEPAMLSLQGYGGNQDDNIATHVTKTQDGGFIILIETSSDLGTGNIDSLCATTRERGIFIKYNSDASVVEWIKCSTDGTFLFPKNNGNFIFGGTTLISSDYYAFKIIEEDPSGSIIWYKTYGDSAEAELGDMIATNDGGYIMVGEVYYTDSNFTVHNSGSLNADIGVLKLDSLGNKQWSKAIGGSDEDESVSVIPGPDDGYYIYGETISNDYDCSGLHGPADSAADAYIVRLNSKGDILWHRDLGGSGIDGYYGWGTSDDKGGVLLANGSNSIDGDVHHNITGNIEYWVLEVDSNSNIVWENNYGSSNDEVPFAICKATDGSVWITGVSTIKDSEVDTAYGKGDAWIVHTDSAGNFLSGKVIGESKDDEGEMIYPLPGGGVLTGGYYSGTGGNVPATYYGQMDVFLATIAPWTTGVKNVVNPNPKVTVYPNPATQLLHINVAPKDNFSLIINNILGQQVYMANTVAGSIAVDISQWAKGVYVIRWQGENGSVLISKLIKN